jgi:hypothetical protein
MNNWCYYNHALLPGTAPHEEADVTALDKKETWKPEGGRHPIFARWTSHFDCGSDKLAAYAYVRMNSNWINMPVLKASPAFEKLGVNAALVHGLCEYFKEDLAKGKYICDGERNIYHSTNFQSYLEKYFGFRKAYCHLHLRYNILYYTILYYTSIHLEKYYGIYRSILSKK